jgi:PKD repeat protein
MKTLRILFCVSFILSFTSNAQSQPNLGIATNYAILAGSSINSSDIIYVRGNAGSNSSIGSGIIASGNINQNGTGDVSQALSDLDQAINYCDTLEDTLIDPDLSGQILTEGVYVINGDARLNGTLTLNGNASSIFIFKIDGSLIVESFSLESFGNVKASNIYWVISDQNNTVTINEDVSFSGIILARGNITLGNHNSGYLAALTTAGTETIFNNHPNNFKFLYSQYEIENLNSSISSNVNCITDEIVRYEALLNPMLRKNMVDGEAMTKSLVNDLSSSPPTNDFIIPVVVHVIYRSSDYCSSCNGGNGTYISHWQVENAINELNNYYQGYMSGYEDMHIKFCLASTDLSGSTLPGPHPGIDWIQNDALTDLDFYTEDAALKALSYQPSANYLNIWVVRSISVTGIPGQVNGYAYLPNTAPSPLVDGIVIRSDRFGNISTCSQCAAGTLASTAAGDVLTHEAGHYLNLQHTFFPDNTCSGMLSSGNLTDGCDGFGDYCCDTPPQYGPYWGCVIGNNTCTETYPPCPCNDPVKNILSYSDPGCRDGFTADQRSRMQATCLGFRSTLVSAINLQMTHVACAGSLTANFGYGPSQICDNATVNFNATFTLSGTTYYWDFGDGNTSTAGPFSVQNIYTNPGVYTVTLTVTYNSSTVTNVMSNIIYVTNCSQILCNQGNWYFGMNSSLDFSSGMPQPPLIPPFSAMNAPEAAISQSDAFGNLLFYSNGIDVWNNVGTPTITGLIGDPSSAQAICIPKPGSSTRYYIIYKGTTTWPTCYYTLIDISSGSPQVVNPINQNKNIAINTPDQITEAMTAIPKCNGSDYWLILHSTNFSPSKYFVVSITSSGIGALTQHNSLVTDNAGVGCMKASPDGTMIALSLAALAGDDGCELVRFNPVTGIISNPQLLRDDLGNSASGYGVSFSPNSRVLYLSSCQNYNLYLAKSIFQYDLLNLTNPPHRINVYTAAFANLQLGPDHKIYIAKGVPMNNYKYLSVINFPDNLFTSYSLNECGFNPNGIYLDPLNQNHSSFWSLPNMIDVYACSAAPPYPTDFTYTVSNCNTFTFTANPCGTTYAWNFGDATTGSGNPVTHTYTGIPPVSYTVTLTVNGSSTVSNTISINPLIQPIINGPVCVANLTTNYVYTVSNPQNGYTYTWSVVGGNVVGIPPLNGINVQWNISGFGTVTVTATDENGCISTANITVHLSPVASISPPSISICDGSPTTLTALPAAGVTYLWSDNLTTTQTFIASTSGTYTVTVTDGNGCTATASSVVSIYNPPVVSASNNSPICEGENLLLYSNPPGLTYAWTGPNSFTSTLQNPIISNSTTVASGNYTVIVTDGNGCTASATTTSVINPTPTATAFADPSAICAGSCAILFASGGGTYLWSDGQSGSPITVCPEVTTLYTVTVTDNNGCTATASITIIVNQPPTVSAGGNSPVCLGGDIYLVSLPPGLSYNWAGPNGFSSSLQNPVINNATINNAGTYTVTVTDNNGCTGSASITITVDETCCSRTNATVTIPPGSPYMMPTTTWSNDIVDVNADIIIDGTTLNITSFSDVEIATGRTIQIMNGGHLIVEYNAHLHACDDMWNGIVVADNTSDVSITSRALIEDAIIAVSTDNEGPFYIDNATFDKNWIGIHVGNGDYSTSYITSTNLLCTGGLRPPYSGSKSHRHMDISNVTDIVIGQPGFGNHFDNAAVGIEGNISTITIMGNYFTNFLDMMNCPDNCPIGTAVWVKGTAALPSTLVAGGLTNNYGNSFTTCTRGILAEHQVQCDIQHNSFTNINGNVAPNAVVAGVRIFDNRDLSQIIKNNIFNNFRNGISLKNNTQTTSIIIEIEQNHFNPTFATQNNGSTAVRVNNAFTTNSPLPFIYNNFINRVGTGVAVTNHVGALAVDNWISFNNFSPSNQFWYGIRFNGGNNNGIDQNHVTKLIPNPSGTMIDRLFGISVEKEVNTKVTTNYLTRMGTGILFLNSAGSNTTHCNENDFYMRGISLINNRIGTQGLSGNPSGNSWTNFVAALDYRIYDDGIFSGLADDWYINASGNQNLPVGTFNFSYPFVIATQGTTGSSNCPLDLPDEAKQHDMAMIVTEAGDFAELPTDQLYALKASVYEELKQNNNLMYLGTEYDGVLQDFFAYMQETNPGQISDSKDLLANGSVNQALIILSNITPQNLSEQNAKTVQLIYAITYASNIFDFTDEQRENLQSIAQQNPYSGGNAVYTARVMLDMDVNDYFEESSDRPINTQGKNDLETMYPNPTTGNATYRITLSEGCAGLLQICDILGNHLQSYKLVEGNNQFVINCSSFNQGVYLYKLILNDSFVSTKKLTIIK